MGKNSARRNASRGGFFLLFMMFLMILSTNLVPAPIFCDPRFEPCPFPQECIDGICQSGALECFDDFDCAPGEQCIGGICEAGIGSPNGASCSANFDCSSGNCVYDINCDKSLGTCLQHCAPSTDECARSGYISGYDTYQTYGSWICLGKDLGGRQCTSSNTCSQVGSYYCAATSWTTTEPSSCACNSVATSNVFKVRTAAGNELFRVDTDGDVAFQGALFYDSDINEVSSSQFQLKRSGSNSVFRVLGANKIAVYEGTKYQSQSSLSLAASGDFAIKNSAGAVVFKISQNGNVYSKGKIASGCGCQAGTYSNPTTLAGNYVLSTTSGTSDYAAGYCAAVRGCQNYKNAITTTTSRYACRCDYTGAFGCGEPGRSSSCTTASSSWPSYSSITCY